MADHDPSADVDGALLRDSTRPYANAAVFNCDVLDYVMHFLTIREACRLRYVCRAWDGWVSPVLERGAFDTAVSSGLPEERERYATLCGEEVIRRNTVILTCLANGDVVRGVEMLKRVPFNMPLISRRVVNGEGTGEAELLSPVVRMLEYVNVLVEMTDIQEGRSCWFLAQPLNAGSDLSESWAKPYFSTRKSLYSILDTQWGDAVPEVNRDRAFNSRKFASRWYRHVLHGLRLMRREGWLSPRLPLLEYALYNVDQMARWTKVRRLVDVLMSEFGTDVNATKFTTGATALHIACGYGGIAYVSPLKIKLLVRRGARWDIQTTTNYGIFDAGVTALDVLKRHASTPDKLPSSVPLAVVEALIADAERGERYTAEDEEVSDAGSDDDGVVTNKPSPENSDADESTSSADDSTTNSDDDDDDDGTADEEDADTEEGVEEEEDGEDDDADSGS